MKLQLLSAAARLSLLKQRVLLLGKSKAEERMCISPPFFFRKMHPFFLCLRMCASSRNIYRCACVCVCVCARAWKEQSLPPLCLEVSLLLWRAAVPTRRDKQGLRSDFPCINIYGYMCIHTLLLIKFEVADSFLHLCSTITAFLKEWSRMLLWPFPTRLKISQNVLLVWEHRGVS